MRAFWTFVRPEILSDGECLTFKTIWIAEVIAVALAVPILTLSGSMLLRRRRFAHPNFRLIFFVGILVKALDMASRIVEIRLNLKTLERTADAETQQNLESLATLRMILMLYKYGVAVEFLLERSATMVFIEDYEQHPRLWVGVGAIFVNTSLVLTFGALFITVPDAEYALLYPMIYFLLNGAGTFPGIMILHRVCIYLNRKFVGTRVIQMTAYSLSTRYQIRENLRTFKMIIDLFWVIIPVCSCYIALFFVPLYYSLNSFNRQLIFQVQQAIDTFTVIQYSVCLIPLKSEWFHFAMDELFSWPWFRSHTSWRSSRHHDVTVSLVREADHRQPVRAENSFVKVRQERADAEARQHFEAMRAVWA